MRSIFIKSPDPTGDVGEKQNATTLLKVDAKNAGILDRIGVWVTSVCALHCLLLPILLPLAPLIASTFVASEWFERVILSASILIGFAALFIGFHQYHRQLYPLYSLTLGGLIYWNKNMFGESYEPYIVGVGAIFIIGAHLANLRLCKKCTRCDEC